jgi:hydrogenase/urease accessory protein HupE
MTLLRLLLVLAALIAAPPARADELRPGYLELTQEDTQHWRMLWKAPVLGGLATRAQPDLPTFCTRSAPVARLEGASLVAESRLTCSRDLAGARIGLKGMEATFTDALVRVAPLGRPVQAARLTPRETSFEIAAVPDRWEVARSYFAIGVEHIVFGWDHLLFVIALVLLLGSLWSVVKAATAFTVAHSITLVGTTLGLFGLPQAPVEALIALSIVFLAVEIAKKGDGPPRLAERIPWIVAFLFGLIHGFGFAGALREIGLPASDVPMALLTFNLGVEAGQLAIVAAVLGIIVLVRRLAPPMLRPATRTATYGIGTIASFWFIERMVG